MEIVLFLNERNDFLLTAMIYIYWLNYVSIELYSQWGLNGIE